MPPLIKQRKQDDNAPMTLPGVATATAPTHTEEWAVPLSMDLSGAVRVTPSGLMAGERLQDSATKSYLAVSNDCNATVISKTTAVTIGGGVANDTRLIGITFTKALTGTCVITGFADSDGAAQSVTYPATTAVDKDWRGALNSAGALTVTCSDSGDDNVVTVLWRPAI